jgi:hypothetical protein
MIRKKRFFELVKRPIQEMDRQRFVEYLVVILFEVLFAALAVQAVLIHDTPRSYFVVLAMLIAVLPVVLEKILHFSLPLGIKIFVPFALFLHIAGGIMRWYWIYQPWYDKFAHVISALTIALLIFALFLYLDWCDIRFKTWQIMLGIFIITIFLGSIWEVGERTFDIMLKSSYNNGLIDTIGDTIANFVGTIIAILAASWYIRKIPPGEPLSYFIRKQQ